MLPEAITIKSGDAEQLHYLRDEYNYLLQQKWEMEQTFSVRLRNRKTIQPGMPQYQQIRQRLLAVDDTRTQFVLPQNPPSK